MNTTKLKFIAVIVAGIFLSSCSNDNEIGVENNTSSLLKSFNLKRTLNGSYYLDFNVNEGTKVDKVYDVESRINKFYLYSSQTKTDKSISENLTLDGSQIKVGFVDINSKVNPTITIEDTDLVLAKSAPEKLTSFGVSTNEDGTFNLDFTVAQGVAVSFNYNDKLGVYEIHLKSGKSSETSFSQTYEKEDGKPLIIDFVNYTGSKSAKTDEELLTERKPRVIIDSGTP